MNSDSLQDLSERYLDEVSLPIFGGSCGRRVYSRIEMQAASLENPNSEKGTCDIVWEDLGALVSSIVTCPKVEPVLGSEGSALGVIALFA